MSREKGNLSVNTENILPIIKRWLYSDKDIFAREMISNATDAINKMKRVISMGEFSLDGDVEYKIIVKVNKKENTISFTDNGIGMTGEEVKKYINQIAFSGANEFLEKYKDKADQSNEIIGHFGLGFYSAFMVADKVAIDTLSYQEGAGAVRWESEGNDQYEMDVSPKEDRGTTITLYVNDDGKEYLDEYAMRQVIVKYCAFMPYEIFLEDEDKKKDDKEEVKPLNDVYPLWLKQPRDVTDEEYKEFYKKVFMDFNDPLFWIHLNMDYPFNLKGILYFPKLKHEFETGEGQVKLYNNQVFVADNIKEVIPEFLLLLKGTIDCPDLPLNVSRSFLQNDGYVNKLSSHITRKVADKLISLYENERENYNKYWEDINPFVKYGCLREEKFFDRVKDYIIYKSTGGDYPTLKEYLERNEEKHKNKVFYVTDMRQQAQYVKLFEDNDLEAVILNTMIDSHFVQFMEMHSEGVTFSRVDADVSDLLKDKEKTSEKPDKKEEEKLVKLFKDALGREDLEVKVEGLKVSGVPALMILEEQSRRMKDMGRFFGGAEFLAMGKDEGSLVLNSNNKLIKSLLKSSADDDAKLLANHVYDLAMLSHKQLEPDELTRFIDRSNRILEKISDTMGEGDEI